MRKGITSVFAEFYKDLYSMKNDETTCDHPDDDIEDGEQVSQKKWNQRQQGIKAEVIKGSDEETTTIVHDIFLQLDHQTKFHGFQLT